MPNRKKQVHRPTSTDLQNPTPHRPQTVRRRISSGFISFLANLPLRRSIPQQEPHNRPRTAPNPDRVLVRRITQGKKSGQALIPRVLTPSLSEPDQPCPYDATNYQSFPSIERSRCDFWGLRPPSRSKPSEPCNDCRSKSPFSHLKFAFRKKSGLELREDTPAPSFTLGWQHSPPSSDDMIRVVPPHIAAKRIGNPPRTASLPPGISRSGATNTILSPPPAPRPPKPSPDAQQRIGTVKHRRNDRDTGSKSKVRPQSPELHYIHGLPTSKAYPNVHKREVAQHKDCPPSPFANLAQAARARTVNADPFSEFSETCFHSRSEGLRSTVRSERTERSVLEPQSREQIGSIDENSRRGDVHHRREPEARGQQARVRKPPSSAPDRTKNANSDGDETVVPSLRGGGGDEQRSCSFMLKQLLLTCHRPGHGTPSSDADLPPPRTPNPAEVARAMRRTSGTARLPKNISRNSPATTLHQPSARTSRTASFAVAHAQSHSVFWHLLLPLASVFQRQPESPINIPLPPTSSHPTTQPQPSSSPPVVGLRGGAGSPSTLRDHECLPACLFWLAGGMGKPVTAAAWKTKRPKKRMGGLVGMAIFGMGAGRKYARQDHGKEEGDVHEKVEEEEKVESGVKEARAESVKSSKTHSSKSSKSSTKSHGSRSSKSSASSSRSSKSSRSSADAAKEGEGQKDVPLDPVPEEAAVPAAGEASREAPAEEAAPVPPDGAAAKGPPAEAQAEGEGGGEAAAAGDGAARA